eukprot:3955408-Pleurochrysis_carterae.AAC.1
MGARRCPAAALPTPSEFAQDDDERSVAGSFARPLPAVPQDAAQGVEQPQQALERAVTDAGQHCEQPRSCRPPRSN